jgi:hypothetical protein
MRSTMLLLWFVPLLAFATCQQASAPASAPAPTQEPDSRAVSRPASIPAAVLKELVEKLKVGGVELDVPAATVTIEGEIQVTGDFLEYLLIGRTGKAHEALVRCEVKGSVLKAGLMALGFQDGRNMDYREKNPPPTEEEMKKGADFVEVIPPNGQTIYLSLQWQDENAKTRRYRTEDLWIDVRTELPPAKCRWVYFGGREAALYKGEPPVFVADYEENLVSLCYMKPDNHIITIDHDAARDDKIWWPNMKLLPPRGTPVKMLFSTRPIPNIPVR